MYFETLSKYTNDSVLFGVRVVPQLQITYKSVIIFLAALEVDNIIAGGQAGGSATVESFHFNGLLQ